MPDVVIDACVAIDMVFEAREPEFLERLRAEDVSLTAPWIWRLEVANAILARERRKLITYKEAVECLRFLDAMNISFVAEPTDRSLEQLAAFARPLQLTAYDAAYVELALTRSLAILTTDQNIKDAANRLGINVIA